MNAHELVTGMASHCITIHPVTTDSLTNTGIRGDKAGLKEKRQERSHSTYGT